MTERHLKPKEPTDNPTGTELGAPATDNLDVHQQVREAARRADEAQRNAAFTAMILAEQQRLLRLARYLLSPFGNQYIAEDVVSTTFLNAFRSLDTWRSEKGSMWGWLTVIMRNVIKDLGSKQTEIRRHEWLYDVGGSSDGDAGPWYSAEPVSPDDEFAGVLDAIQEREIELGLASLGLSDRRLLQLQIEFDGSRDKSRTTNERKNLSRGRVSVQALFTTDEVNAIIDWQRCNKSLAVLQRVHPERYPLIRKHLMSAAPKLAALGAYTLLNLFEDSPEEDPSA